MRGDGEYNNSSSLQNLINYAYNITIDIPSGVYVLKEQITFPDKWQVVMKGQGKRGRRGLDFSEGDGIVKFSWQGENSYDSVFVHQGERFDGNISNIYLRNESDNDNIHGFLFKERNVNNKFEDLLIVGFDKGFVIEGSFFYTEFNRCAFEQNRIGFCAGKEDGSKRAYGNNSSFNFCRFHSNTQYGFYGNQIGEIINIKGSYIEKSGSIGVLINNCGVVNIEDCYIEFNGEGELDERKGTISVSSSGAGFYTNESCILNLKNNFIFERGEDKLLVFVRNAYDTASVHLNIENNLIITGQMEDSYVMRASNVDSSRNTSIRLSGNSYYSTSQNFDNVIKLTNRTISQLLNLEVSDNDLFSEAYFPYVKNIKNSRLNIIPENFSLGNPELDIQTRQYVDFPELETEDGFIDVFRNTNTSGKKQIRIFKGDGSSDIVGALDSDGIVKISEIYFGTSVSGSRKITYGTGNPKGSTDRDYDVGAIFIRIGSGAGLYYKKYFGVDGWVRLDTEIENIDNISTPDATDETETQDLVNELKAKINELLLAMKDSGQMGD